MNHSKTSNTPNIQQLIEIMARLRDPKNGCPWDLKQDFSTILPFTIEEVYEVADAIERNDIGDLKDELGDLLFQIIFYSQIASERQQFDFNDVIESICAKLIRRHPHVFDDQFVVDEKAIEGNWEKFKKQERQEKSTSDLTSLLDDIPKVLPELKRAQKIQHRVAKQGFDWPQVDGVWEKLLEESDEVKQAAQENDFGHLQEEIGDLLFVCVNLARHYKVDADYALRLANQKFEKRFRKVEQLAEHNIAGFDLSDLEKFWQLAKKGT